jgi:guanosine-3',5'-bis(diphosphate) 3'-pyrophosphohydrolase
MNTHIAEVRLLEAANFAAEKHRFQRRKDKNATLYINHPIRVAFTLTAAGESDVALLMAALLHDTVEDTETTLLELESKFGPEVAGLVAELTDDKTLSKEQRKAFQREHAAGRSLKARKIKLADKICNLYDLLHHPPGEWSDRDKRDYFEWARSVVHEMRGTQTVLEEEFDELYRQGQERFHHAVEIAGSKKH